jgi:hypothetical protein
MKTQYLSLSHSPTFGDDVSVISETDGEEDGGENTLTHSLKAQENEASLTDSSLMLNPPFK